MQTNIVEVRKNIVLLIPNVNVGVLSVPINIDFIPDEMIVRTLQYCATASAGEIIINGYNPCVPVMVNVGGTDVPTNTQGTPTYAFNDVDESELSLVYFSLVNNYIGEIFDAPAYNHPNTIWTIQKPVRGDYEIKILDFLDNIVENKGGSLSITLEFVKYKNRKQDKIY